MRHLLNRFKLLLKGEWWEFWHYGEAGFYKLYYRGLPVILKDDIPDNELHFHQKNGNVKVLNIKTGRVKFIKARRKGKVKEVNK